MRLAVARTPTPSKCALPHCTCVVLNTGYPKLPHGPCSRALGLADGLPRYKPLLDVENRAAVDIVSSASLDSPVSRRAAYDVQVHPDRVSRRRLCACRRDPVAACPSFRHRHLRHRQVLRRPGLRSRHAGLQVQDRRYHRWLECVPSAPVTLHFKF